MLYAMKTLTIIRNGFQPGVVTSLPYDSGKIIKLNLSYPITLFQLTYPQSLWEEVCRHKIPLTGDFF